jgi:hypothetical protein
MRRLRLQLMCVFLSFSQITFWVLTGAASTMLASATVVFTFIAAYMERLRSNSMLAEIKSKPKKHGIGTPYDPEAELLNEFITTDMTSYEYEDKLEQLNQPGDEPEVDVSTEAFLDRLPTDESGTPQDLYNAYRPPPDDILDNMYEQLYQQRIAMEDDDEPFEFKSGDHYPKLIKQGKTQWQVDRCGNWTKREMYDKVPKRKFKEAPKPIYIKGKFSDRPHPHNLIMDMAYFRTIIFEATDINKKYALNERGYWMEVIT